MTDGQRQLIVTGSTQVVSDPDEVFRLHAERIRQIALRQESDSELAERLRREERVVLILTPARFYPASLR